MRKTDWRLPTAHLAPQPAQHCAAQPAQRLSSTFCQKARQLRGERTAELRQLLLVASFFPSRLATPRDPLTLCSLPRPLLPLPSTPERSPSPPSPFAAATNPSMPSQLAHELRLSAVHLCDESCEPGRPEGTPPSSPAPHLPPDVVDGFAATRAPPSR